MNLFPSQVSFGLSIYCSVSSLPNNLVISGFLGLRFTSSFPEFLLAHPLSRGMYFPSYIKILLEGGYRDLSPPLGDFPDLFDLHPFWYLGRCSSYHLSLVLRSVKPLSLLLALNTQLCQVTATCLNFLLMHKVSLAF